MQVRLPEDGCMVPFGQVTHSVALSASTYCPLGHGSQRSDDTLGANLPGVQGKQSGSPGCGAYLPAGQVPHCTLPLPVANEPAR